MKRLTISLLFFLLLCAGSFADEEIKVKGELFSTLELSSDATDEIIEKAVIKAAIGRRWNIVSKSENLVVLNLTHRGYDSTLYLKFADSKVSIYSDSWAVNKKGEKKKRKDPTGWIENLKKDIGVFADREIYL